MTTPLPSTPDLDQLKRQAKDLLKQFKAGDPDAAARIHTHLPNATAIPNRAAVTARASRASGRSVALPTAGQEPPIGSQDPGTRNLTLAEAQLVIAREYGFASWPRLKRHVEETQPDEKANLDAFRKAVHAGDSRKVRALLRSHASVRAKIDAPICHFDTPPIVNAASRGDRKTVDVLADYGADINARSVWWAGGFGVLPNDDPEFAEYLVGRGAAVDVWAAAGMNRLERLHELIAADPACVNARGGDGQGPLQFAASVDAARILLDAGADIDMRDLDHESTAAQRMCVGRPEVCRYLLSRGAKLDIFMAVQLGDLELVKRALAEDPTSRTARVGQGQFVTKESTGGHIYIYVLKDGGSPLYLAADLGHSEIYRHLLSLCTPEERLLAACWTADEQPARATLAGAPGLIRALPPEKMRLIADAAWMNKTEAVRLMIKLGFDLEARGDHESTALNRAAVRGFADLIDLLLDSGASLESRNDFGGRPLGACFWGAENFRDPNGDYVRCVERMLAAGAPIADARLDVDNREVAAAARRFLQPLEKTNVIAAIKLGSLTRVRALLDRDPALLDSPVGGTLPVYEAVRSNRPEILTYLLERGADLTLKQPGGGKSVEEFADACERPEMAKLLRGNTRGA